MTLDTLLSKLEESPLVASVQASPGSPVQDTDALLRMAQASLQEGVTVLRLEGAETISAVREATSAVCIGLIKRQYDGSEVFITPTRKEVDELLETGCEVVSIDATERARPDGEQFADLVRVCHEADRLVMADCDTFAAGQNAVKLGADILGPTLAGFTPDTSSSTGPDFACLRGLLELDAPVLAEGRYMEEWHVEAAMRMGAFGVVVGGALNDPVKQTRRFLGAAQRHQRPVAAFDLGGTWMRFGLFSPSWELMESEWVSMPDSHTERLDWMNERVSRSGADRAGVSCGGLIDPVTGQVLEARDTIKSLVGGSLKLDAETYAINDGLAAAWGHACHPDYAGMSVATLALGTGVGSGFVHHYEFVPESKGLQACGINDLFGPSGKTIEEVCGGLVLGKEPDKQAQAAAVEGAKEAVRIMRSVYMPSTIFVSGGVGLSDWMLEALKDEPGVVPSPFEHDAGLYGAAALALFPPRNIFKFPNLRQ
ncbi:MAG: putative N-acetylmannosamine-6-phosphate 2-epimerase [Armatimonadetes bacterium]|nr:putative N-acetylmannosamine-6-phosphate 2-epimerase [Armatimonadota bacterium]